MSTEVSVETAIRRRRSVRSFLDTPVDEAVVRELLELAACAPSVANVQPWIVYVVTGALKDRICSEVTEAFWAGFEDPALAATFVEPEPHYFARKWAEPYLTRRRKMGRGLYGMLGVDRADPVQRRSEHARNFSFFDAPVGLFCTVDNDVGAGGAMDTAMFLQNLCLAAVGRGLDTCIQKVWNDYHSVVLPLLGAPANERLVCGLALGYANRDFAADSFRTSREDVDVFTTFLS
jgi:nitroreductase